MNRIIAVAALLFWSASAYAEMPTGFADLVDKLSPAVVNISTTQKVTTPQNHGVPFNMEQLPNTPEMEPFRQFFEQYGQQQGQPQEHDVTSLGSGFIIDASGFVITNNHVIDDAEDITVTTTDNSKYKAKLIGRDKKTDLALLKIDAKKPLPFVPLGDSDKMRVGDWVIAIGNPYGLGGSVTQGIISARQRSINAGPYDDFLQTDAPINRGNSGGPLFNTMGEVIGINSAIFSPSGGSIGIGFAIPTTVAKPVIDQLKQFGKTHRGWLGVKIQEVSPEIAESVGLKKVMGAMVIEVNPESPGGKAGIKAGDVITHFDGREISEMRFLPRMVAETAIGKTVTISLWRNGKSQDVKVTLGELNEAEDVVDANKSGPQKPGAAPAGEEVLGLRVAPLSDVQRQQLHLAKEIVGLIITDVTKGSEAAKKGVRRGDVILQAGNDQTPDVAALKKQIDASRNEGHQNLLIKVMRGKDTMFVTLPLDEKK